MNDPSGKRQNLVGATADRLRDMVFAAAPDALVGSLQELSRKLDVGIVTIQQAARVLEHEGLIEARRGPGGGYYGRRPNAAAVERSVAAYLRANPTSFEEALNITSLLFTELAAEAAACRDDVLRAALRDLLLSLEACRTGEDCGAFETKFQTLLFRMVNWPLFELLTLVTLKEGMTRPGRRRQDEQEVKDWRDGRERIVLAILSGDQGLARFEAHRNNRLVVMRGATDSAARW